MVADGPTMVLHMVLHSRAMVLNDPIIVTHGPTMVPYGPTIPKVIFPITGRPTSYLTYITLYSTEYAVLYSL